MYLYKLPEHNQYIFIKDKSLYNLYQARNISEVLLVPEKVYQKYEGHYGLIPSERFSSTAFESLKEQFLQVFRSNQLNSLQKVILSFFIQQYKISKDQYVEALQKILAGSHSFEIQMELVKYERIKKQYPSSFLQKLWKRISH